MTRSAKSKSKARISDVFKTVPKKQRLVIEPYHVQNGHYVMFENERMTSQGKPAFTRYTAWTKIEYKSGSAYVDETLQMPLTKQNSYIGRVIWVRTNSCDFLEVKGK